MSLDVYLNSTEERPHPQGSGIFIRENGQTKEITEAEWFERNPDREPVRYNDPNTKTTVLFHANLTHNLGPMAAAAGIYEPLWRPEEKGWTHAKQLISPLEAALEDMKARPERYKSFNPDNGWGSYEVLLEVVESYLAACNRWPDATIEVSR